MRRKPSTPSRVQLSAERRQALLKALVDHFAAEFDEPLSAFRAEALLEVFLRTAGSALYNQGVQDAVAALQAKLADVESELAEPE